MRSLWAKKTAIAPGRSQGKHCQPTDSGSEPAPSAIGAENCSEVKPKGKNENSGEKF
ncbi:hypothetical protein [Phormidium sp. CCY1219]|uniref:hypothetical protein n=1 Tax=Phormidium sp. CCY1219 TaxID=2886104 RepID=UPI002D1E622A|nr:hypothetical protein [Phormidium sp. CCY1219]MEB3827474.1 hypothetical protein [Phormidium sp. CCY1219]